MKVKVYTLKLDSLKDMKRLDLKEVKEMDLEDLKEMDLEDLKEMNLEDLKEMDPSSLWDLTKESEGQARRTGDQQEADIQAGAYASLVDSVSRVLEDMMVSGSICVK